MFRTMFHIALYNFTSCSKDLLARIRHYFGMDNVNDGLLFHSGTYGDYVSYSTTTALDMKQVYRAENIFVTKVLWCKKLERPYHEFLVFHVKEHLIPGMDTVRGSVIIIDRRSKPVSDQESTHEPSKDGRVEHMAPEDEEPTSIPSAPSQVRPKPASLLSSHSVDSVSSSREHDAEDRMYFSLDGSDAFLHQDTRWSKHDICLGFTIRGELLSVTQLAVLARTIHKYHDQYNLFRYQCYWYAEVLFNTIKMILDKHGDLSPGFKVWAEFSPTLKPSLGVGTFKLPGVAAPTVTKPRTSVHERIFTKFQEDWVEEKHKIDEKEKLLGKEEEDLRVQVAKQKAEKLVAVERAMTAEELAAKKDKELTKKDRELTKKDKELTKKDKELATAEEQIRKLQEKVERFQRQSAPAASTHQMSIPRISS